MPKRAERAIALEHGDVTYFTGRPCKRGHISLRQTSSLTCVECRRLNQLGWRASLSPERKRLKSQYERNRRKSIIANGTRRAEVQKRRADKLQRTPAWSNAAAIRELCKVAASLTRLTGESWHVDHELPLRGKFVSGLHVIENLRVIPARENLKKSATFYPS